MLLSLLKFDLEVVCKSGKEMHIADALSCAHSTTPLSAVERAHVEDIDVTVHTALHDSDLNINTLHDVMSTKNADPVLFQLRELIHHGFPIGISSLLSALRCHHSIVHNGHKVDGMLFHKDNIFMLGALKTKMRTMIHKGISGRRKVRY